MLLVFVQILSLVYVVAVTINTNQTTQALLLNGKTASAQTSKADEKLLQTELDIAKALFVEVGDGVEENVTFRNEQCANDEALAAALGTLLNNPTLVAGVKHQCAIPFKPPTIQVNGQGQVSNQTGLPPGL